MTPVRNEAWVLHAFLKATSVWADHIIIADQGSTDGSKEIALSYPKVILIENNDGEYNEAARQKMLIDKARQIDGDKILFALDADEVFTANFIKSEDWRRILTSKPKDVFWFRWANITPDLKEYWTPETFFPWVFHDDGIEPHGNYIKKIHSMRIPYPLDEKQMYYVNDFKVFHLAYISPKRVYAKKRMYKLIDFEMSHRSAVALNRQYIIPKIEERFTPIPNNWLYKELDLFSFIDLKSVLFWFDDYINEKIKLNGESFYKTIDIWDQDIIQHYMFKDPRSITTKMIHQYLRMSQYQSKRSIIKMIDKALKYFGF